MEKLDRVLVTIDDDVLEVAGVMEVEEEGASAEAKPTSGARPPHP